MKVLAFDPGGSTGYFLCESLGKKITPIRIGVLKSKDDKLKAMTELILEADLVVVETFKIRPDKARQGAFDRSDMYTPREIGKIETLCELHGKKLVRQDPSIKPVGYGWANQKYTRGKKGTHAEDAVAHAVYYCVRNLGAVPLEPTNG